MKNINLGQTVHTLANLGVIAGIIFLALELQQNNELLVAQATYSQFAIGRETRMAVMQTDGLPEAMVKLRSNPPLSETEELRLQMLHVDIVDSWKRQFREVQAGRLPSNFIDVDSWWVAIERLPGIRAVYEDDRSILDPQFVRFMDENVVDR